MAITPAEATLRLARKHTADSSAAAERLAALMAKLFASVEGLDDAAMARWLSLAVPEAMTAEAAAWQLGAAYVEVLAQAHAAKVGAVAAADLGSVGAYRVIWQGAMIAARAHAGEGYDAAKLAGISRAESLAVSGYSGADRDGAIKMMRATEGVEHYRRVPVGVSCEFCLTIATRRYFVEDLAPVHGKCDCGVMPVFRGETVDHAVGAAASRALEALSAA